MTTVEPPRSPRYHSLDTWRGLACLAVVFHHSVFYARPEGSDEIWPLLDIARAGWIGVPIFFVISGYCISATADRTRQKGLGIREYVWRRFRRIFPPYWIFLVLAVLLVGALDVLVPGLYADDVEPIPRPWWRSPWQWFGNVTLTETWRAHLVGDRTGYFIGPIWTLCYEEQFYVVTGALLVLARRWFFAAAGLVSLAVVAVVVACSLRDVDIEGFFFDGSWLMFASGVLIYWGINYRGPAVRAGSLVLFVAVTCWSTFGRSSFEPYVGWRTDHELGVATAFAAILLLTHRWDEPLARARALAPIAWCGTMCYSLYLVHWPIVKPISHLLAEAGVTSHVGTMLITVPICVVVSCAIAWQFHRLVEVRFLNTPTAKTPGTSAALAA